MPKALQVVSGRVTNPGATITGLTANTGDSFAVKNANQGSQIYLEQAWAQEATIGVLRITSPLLHDNAQGIRLRVAQTAKPLLPMGLEQPLQPQDVLTVALSGGGAETDVGAFLVYYADLPGASARLVSWEQIDPLIVQDVGVELNMTTGGTVGQYGGSQAANANFDLLQRTRDYALLGYLVDTTVGVVGISGPDTSNLRVGGPGNVDPVVTRDWFVQLARAAGRPMIPVLNAANIGATTVDLVHTAAAAAVNVTLILAELSSPQGQIGA